MWITKIQEKERRDRKRKIPNWNRINQRRNQKYPNSI